MNNKTLLAAAMTAIIAASCSSGSDDNAGTTVIDVAAAISTPVDLKVSDLGSKITYVPLETTDSSLIPETWTLRPTNTHLLVVNYSTSGFGSQNCLAFDVNGAFLGSIGHTGDDPEAYSTPFPLISQNGEKLYFMRWGDPSYDQVYSVDGKYQGRVFPAVMGSPSSSLLVDTTIVAVDCRVYEGVSYISVCSGGINGGVADTLVVKTLPESAGDGRTVYQHAVINSAKGVMPNGVGNFQELEEMAGERRHIYSADRFNPRLWRVGKELHYLQPLTDTIYYVSTQSVEVAYTFDCGDNALSRKNYNKDGIKLDDLFVTEMCENEDYIVFGASRGWLRAEEHEPFVGYFDKKSGKTYATQADKGFVDDLTGFMPFYPVMTNPRGDLFGIITIDDIAKWTEEHPDAELPEALKGLAEDANPICVIVSK